MASSGWPYANDAGRQGYSQRVREEGISNVHVFRLRGQVVSDFGSAGVGHHNVEVEQRQPVVVRAAAREAVFRHT